MNNVFVYGTLMFPEVVLRVAGWDRPGEPATLKGFRRYEANTRQRGNYPVIVPDPCGTVDGLIYQGMSGEQLQQLDDFEFVSGELYNRQAVEIDLGQESLSAQVYVAGPELFRRLREPLHRAWHPLVFQRDQLSWYLGNEISDR